MKKILYIFLLLMMIGCGKEPETEKTVEKSQNLVEQTVKEEQPQEIKGLEIVSIKTNSDDEPRIDIEFSQELEGENLDAFIKISPETSYKILKDKNRILVIGNFKIGEVYDVEILKNIKDKNGRVLKENYKKNVSFREIEPKLSFSSDGIILPSINNKKIAFKSINVKKVNIKIKKIYENNFTQFLQDFVFKGNGNIFDYQVEDNLYKAGDVVFEKDYDLNYEKNIWHQNEIELENFLDNKGLFLLEISFDENGIDYIFPENIESWQKYSLIRNNGRIGKAILLSNVGIIAQKDREKTSIIPMDILKNTPIENAKVKIISTNNQVLAEGVTDSKGEFSFPNNDKMMYALVENGEEKSILKFEDSRLSYDGFAVGGAFSSNGVKNFIYTDRGIYRPGDEIYLSMIIRNDKGDFPDNHPLKINVYSPRGKKIVDDEVIKDGKGGFYTWKFKTDLDSETGIWKIEVQVGDRKFVKDISVETIVPYKIKVETDIPEKIDLKENEKFNVSVKSDYLFGAPANDLKYSVELDVREKEINFEKYQNYNFKNPTSYSYYYQDYKDGVLDGNGKGEIIFDVKRIAPQNINLTGIVTTRVIETGGRPVIKKDIVSLNKFDTYVGIEFPKDRYIKTGDKINLQVVAVSEDGKNLVPNRKLKYRVYKNQYSWWWDYGSYNSFVRSIKTDRNTTLLFEKEFLSSDKPYLIDYEMKGEGEVFVEVEDMETKQSTGINLYASTWQDSSTNKKIDKLKIETDKEKYNIGDIAKVTFEGTKGAKALVTIEKSGNILDKVWVDANELKNIYEIKVTEDMFPNAYISIGLFQDYENLENDRPVRLYGAVPILVENEETKLKIKLETPKEIKPNEKFKLQVKNLENKKMKYTVAVVDQGLLDITAFETPDPWKYFYQKEALQGSYFDNYSEIMGKTFGKVHEILKTGGDGFVEEMASVSSIQRVKNMGIEDVQRFKPVAMFKGVLETDENGFGEVEFQMPNYMGAVKVMVVGADSQKYGNAESEIIVKAPVVADITLPRNLKVQDEFQIPIKVFALEENLGEVEVKVESFGKTQNQKLDFSKKENKTIYFNEKIPNEVGNSKIKITVSSKDYSYEDIVDININSNNPYIYNEETKILKKSEEVSYEQPKDYIKGTVKSYLTISNTPILGIDKRLSWLIRYPYGCVEQTTSTMFPQIYIDRLTRSQRFNRAEILKNINGGIERLIKFQLYDGSFAYWIGGETDIWATNYVGHFLVEAKNLGYYIPNDMYERWRDFTRKLTKSSDVDFNIRAYAIYILSLTDTPEVSQLNMIYENYFDKLNNISKWFIASAYKNIGEEKLAKEIGDKLDFSINNNEEFRNYSYGSDIRDKSIILGAYYNIFGKVDEKLYNEILNEIKSDEWLSTQSLGYSLMTLAKLTNGGISQEVEGDILIDGERIPFKTQSGIYGTSIPETSKNIKIISRSENNIFLEYSWEGVPINYQMEDIEKNIKIERNYYDINGKVIDPKILSSGDSFWLEIKLLPSDEEKSFYINEMALVQILPTGWEIENIRAVNGEYPEWILTKLKENIDYEDIRDDRVMWFFDYGSYNGSNESFFIKINVVTKGKFDFPGTKAEAMYDKNYQAYLKGFEVEVK